MNKQVSQLKKMLGRFYANWVVDDTNREMFWEEPQASFGSYITTGDQWELLGSHADMLFLWHFSHYINAVLNEDRYPLDEFALCARYAKASVQFEAAFADVDKGGSVLLHEAVFNFSLNILAGWRTDANTVGRLLVGGLDTSLLDLKHNDRHKKGKLFRHFWFLLHLYCSAKGLILDTSLYSYPEDMSPYGKVLADWRTPDVDTVQSFVTAMADFHLREAYETEHDEIAEFDHYYQMLFPHEILSFLRVREWLGLPNPCTFDHPLMNQPLARLPQPVPLPQPDTPLLDQVIGKFKREYPGSFA